MSVVQDVKVAARIHDVLNKLIIFYCVVGVKWYIHPIHTIIPNINKSVTNTVCSLSVNVVENCKFNHISSGCICSPYAVTENSWCIFSILQWLFQINSMLHKEDAMPEAKRWHWSVGPVDRRGLTLSLTTQKLYLNPTSQSHSLWHLLLIIHLPISGKMPSFTGCLDLHLKYISKRMPMSVKSARERISLLIH